MRLRPARPEEAARLSDLCMESKAHWGYDAAFMALCREALTVTTEAIAAGEVVVAVDAADRPLGVAALGDGGRPGLAEIALLFVRPAAMGQGVGRALFAALSARARQAGASELMILADPGAEAFYRRMGAERIGVAPSDAVPGRSLPLLRYDLGLASATCPAG